MLLVNTGKRSQPFGGHSLTSYSYNIIIRTYMCAFGYSMCITCNVQYVLYCTYSDYQYILLTVRFTLHKLTCVHSVTACALHVMYNTFHIGFLLPEKM